LDQLTKYMALTNLQHLKPVVITPFLNLTLTFNRGVAFSFFNKVGFWPEVFLAIIAVIISIAMIIILLTLNPRKRWLACALSLIIGGATGNILDRLIHSYVVDFIDFHFYGWHWPAFNLADSAISIGVIMIIIDIFLPRQGNGHPPVHHKP